MKKRKNWLWMQMLALMLIVGLLTGDVAASTPDADGTDYAADSFVDNNVSGKTSKDLMLNDTTENEGDLNQDGYHWDMNSKTLTLGNSAQFGEVVLPSNHAVTVVTNGENYFNSLSVTEIYKMDITISGNGTLTVQECINGGTDGDTLTVDDDAKLVANGGISIGASGGVNSTVTVKGILSAYENNKTKNVIYAGRVVVEETGELNVSGEHGIVLNGMVVDDERQYDDVFIIEDGGAFHSNCSIYAIGIFTDYMEGLSNENAEKMFALSELYLPLGYEVRAVKGSQNESGNLYQYGITIAKEDAEVKFQNFDLIGAAGSISLDSHEHVLSLVDAVPKTCTENGHTKYWICNICNRMYSDKNGTQQIKLVDTIIPASHELVHHIAKAATCTEVGNIEYWTCSACGKYFADAVGNDEITKEDTIIAALRHDFSGVYDAYDEKGHWHVCHRQGCDATDEHVSHNFVNYEYQNDATYFADGTETAECSAEGCLQTHTRAKTGTMLKDDTAPTGEIKVQENRFKTFINTITFGIFYKDTYDVTITGKDDETGIKSIEYYISETAISETNIAQVTEWKEGTNFNIAEEGKYIIYAKITNKVGNVTYISTDGMVLDKIAPVIGGLTDGKTYCSEVVFTVADENIDYVIVNGEKTTDYILKANGSTYEVKAVDKAGNESLSYKVTVKNGHTFTTYVLKGDATCMADGTETAKCEFCDEVDTRTAVGSKHAHTMTHHEAVEATCTAQGNIEYFSCAECHMNYDSKDGGNILDNVATTIDPNHHHFVHHIAKAATCTEVGNIEYWTCSACGKYFADAVGNDEITKEDTIIAILGHDFSGVYNAYDEKGHWHVCHRQGCDATDEHVSHNFVNYEYNNDATYFADGTETAVCSAEGCLQMHTRAKTGTMLNDDTAPTGEIKVEENRFKAFINTITFGIFYKDTYDVTITGKDDETGIKSIEYYISETAISETNIAQVTEWKEGTNFSIAEEGKYIIYAKITDKVGNVTYISTDGMVLDKIAPVIGGLTDGKTYCSEVIFTVADENIDYVTVNGEKTNDYILKADGSTYILKADGSTYEVKAVDKAGNESLSYKVTVRNGHTFTTYVSNGDATCMADGTETAKCEFCDEVDTRIAIGSKHGHIMTHHEAVAATCTEVGNIEYWICSDCGKYFADVVGNDEITKEDTIIAILGHDFSGAYNAYDEKGHWHVCHRQGCDATDEHVSHNFVNYIYNNDATYLADGTETAECSAEGCLQKHTKAKTGTMLNDDTAPTGEIKVEENRFKVFINTITFGIFYKDTYDVTITGKDDETGIKSIEYYISETAISETNIAQVTEWKEGTNFSIAEEGKYIIYAKITNNVGNVTYISTDGMVLDKIAPVIGGLTDGKTYCSEVIFTVADENIDYVTVNGEKTTDYVLKADGSTYEVKVVDKAGNESLSYKVTVKNDHVFTTYVSNGDATCTTDGTETAKCEFCDEVDTRTAIGSKLDHNFKDGKCIVCGESYSKSDANQTSPSTGDNNNFMLWILLLITVIGVVLFRVFVYVKKDEK